MFKKITEGEYAGMFARFGFSKSQVKVTKTPINRSVSGYGSKLPTQYMVKHASDNVWRRVYVACFSNSGSAYIFFKNEKVLVDFEGV